MKQSFFVTASITMLTAAIGMILWMYGYPPQTEGSPETSIQIRAVVTAPLFWATFGAVLSACAIWFKRHRLAEPAGKASRIPAIGVQLPALLGLLFQILIPLDLYDVIGKEGGQIAFFYFISAVFILIGNYVATAPFGSKIGFRTAATLSDEVIWTKSHRFLGRNLLMAVVVALPLPWLIPGQAAQWVLIGLVACLKAATWLYARRLAARKKLSQALPE